MYGVSWLHVSLARKVSVLFGTAVLLIIAVTLSFPWLQMKGLNEQTLLLQAKRVASLAMQAVDLRQSDWSASQARLADYWPGMVRDYGLDPRAQPVFVRYGSHGQGFQQDAVERLSRDPDQRYYWRIQDQGTVFRFAMAVRDTPLRPHPEALLGIVDVSLPIARDTGVWNWVATVLAGASGAVLAILVFYMVTQRLVLTPLQSLRKAARHVAAGDAAVRAMVKTGDEFETLAIAFNDMLDHLRAAQDEQRKINRSLDIRLGELAETNVALYESNRLKSEFLANVTHELRTPLVSIIGFAELLRDAADGSEFDPQRLSRYSRNILSSGRSLLEIINDILDLTKIEAGKMELHVSEFSIVDLCRDLVDFIRPLADKRGQRLELRLPSQGPLFRSDSGKIKQVLYNLLSNAVKFTPEGGSVEMTLELDGADRVHVIVKDTGPGIPPEQQAAIFEKFHQVDSSRTREHQGTGLGLAITRELVQMLGGSIRLESAPGEGAAFIVTLPIVAERAASRPPIRLT